VAKTVGSERVEERRPLEAGAAPWRQRLHEVIFEADTPAGKAFDVVLLWAIILSVVVVSMESVHSIRSGYGSILRALEWVFTVLFSIEYLLRLLAVRRPARYARSFFGLVDLGSIVPTYLSVVVPGAQSLVVIRMLRLLRVFRVLKLARYQGAAEVLSTALRASRQKIIIFLSVVLTIDFIVGAAMYLLEGEAHGFTSIPRGVYWAIVTMTTVGYGDIAPASVPGQILAAMLMILGYAIIAVPTGIVSVELSKASSQGVSTQACPSCSLEGHDVDALHCKYCGTRL